MFSMFLAGLKNKVCFEADFSMLPLPRSHCFFPDLYLRANNNFLLTRKNGRKKAGVFRVKKSIFHLLIFIVWICVLLRLEVSSGDVKVRFNKCILASGPRDMFLQEHDNTTQIYSLKHSHITF